MFFSHPETVASPDSGMQNDIYRPLATTLFSLDYHVWALNPWPYHLQSLALHLLNGALVGCLLGALGLERRSAWIGVWLFLFHPCQTETVAWVTQVSTLLCAAGSLAAVVLFLAAEEMSAPRVIGVTLAWGIAVFSKELAVTLPLCMLAAYVLKCRSLERKPRRAPIAVGVWLCALSALYLIWRHHLIGTWSAPTGHASLKSEWLAGVLAFPIYLGKMILPVRLRVSYQYPLLTWWKAACALGVFAIYAAATIYACLRRPILAIALCWIFFTLLPVLHVAPLVPFVAERYFYFPWIGFAIGVGRFYEALPAARAPILAWLIGITFLAAISVMPWRSDISLWANTVRQDPANAFAHACYAEALGDTPLAVEEYEQALNHQPTEGTRLAALANLGGLFYRAGKPVPALQWTLKALALDPGNPLLLHHACMAAQAARDEPAIMSYCPRRPTSLPR